MYQQRYFKSIRCVSLLVVTMALVSVGCGGNPENKTIAGLQEQVKVQLAQIKDLKQQIEDMKSEKSKGDQSAEIRIAEAKKTYEDQLAKVKELHLQKITLLDHEISDLRLELGSVQREKIAVQEINDRGPRIAAAHSARKEYDLMVLGVLLVILIAVLLYVVFRYRSVHDRLNLLVMQQSSELRRIGAKL